MSEYFEVTSLHYSSICPCCGTLNYITIISDIEAAQCWKCGEIRYFGKPDEDWLEAQGVESSTDVEHIEIGQKSLDQL